MASGGLRPGAGRPKGSRNKASVKQIAEITANGGLTPLEYLTSIYQSDELVINPDSGEQEPKYTINQKIDAAKSAAPYVHSKLSSVDVAVGITELSHEEWLEMLK